jgi:hypothetical protein
MTAARSYGVVREGVRARRASMFSTSTSAENAIAA